MPLQIPEQEFDRLFHIVGGNLYGVTVAELLDNPGLNYPKRTLQRRLDQLVSDGRVRPVGNARARRYFAVKKTRISWSEPSVVREDPTEYRVRPDWLSTKAQEIRAILQQPVSERTPVGYDGVFLSVYRPNETFYLPIRLQVELENLGQVGLSKLPAGTYLRQVMDRLLIDLSWNSSRLEGNTYSLLETQRLLELGENAEGKGTEETQMILNHKAAIELLADEAEGIAFNRYTICNLHALLSDNLLPDPGACGRIRSRLVGITGTVFHPLGVPQQIEECFEMILQKASAIRNPFEQAFFAMVHLPYLQPFEDVNKRVSRLAANIPLVQNNLCPLSFVDVEPQDYVGGLLGVYELNRVEYLRDVFVHAYRRSCARYSAVRQSLGDPDPFRLRHRTAIGKFVREVVQSGMDKKVAAGWIAKHSEGEVPSQDRARFIEVVETELGCLHAGNIARYRLRPSEYDSWSKGWR